MKTIIELLEHTEEEVHNIWCHVGLTDKLIIERMLQADDTAKAGRIYAVMAEARGIQTRADRVDTILYSE